MGFSSLSKLQKVCIICFGIAFVCFIVAGVLLLSSNDLSTTGDVNTSNTEMDTTLADEMKNYPQKAYLNQQVEDFILYDADGNETRLSEYRGKNVIILFWTSWCNYCKEELNNIKEYEKLLKKYDDVEFLLLNKLDGHKETITQAEEYLKKNKITVQNYYDVDLKIYNSLGVKVIPTLLGINKEGILKFSYPNNIKNTEQLAALIDYIRFGGSYATEDFVVEKLTGQEGGVYVNYEDNKGASPTGHDVLSESQGILMEYAILTENRELFDRSLNYVTENMLNENSLAAWVVTEAETDHPKKSKVNSLIDDLRIYSALDAANQLWGGYEGLLEQWKTAILKYNTKKDQLVDFYDFKANKKANRLTLCFIDLISLQKITSEDDSSKLLENSVQLLTDGRISDEFPLYYSWYDYKKKEYSKDDFNMAEGMVTLLNLARAGELRKDTVEWLKDTIQKGGIKSRYTVEGDVVKGHNYESTAIYAILVILAKEIDDEELLTQALARMELMRINELGSNFNGSFGIGDGSDIYSFDQCMALLAYAYAEQQ